ncbi:MAG: hypothetical protein ACYTFQ_17395 [Planctomycetota bacterium]
MYEYRTGLGWDKSWGVPMSREIVRNASCGSGGTLTCAADNEIPFMGNQGCLPSVYPENGLDACTTSSGANGTLFCCPPGRPGTGESPGGVVAQAPVASRDITNLQNWLMSQGCSVGSTGADGIYGPNTAAGLQCAINLTSFVNVASQFPFITTLMATPSGEARPSSFSFDPGFTAKTPEQVVAGRGGSAVAMDTGSTATDIAIDEQRAGMLGAIPWWGWAMIAAGGIGALALAGVVVLGKEEDEYMPYGYGY